MLARTLTFGLSGSDGVAVRVEVFTAPGLPAVEIIGLPDTSVRESRDRVNAAIMNSGYEMPIARTTVSLAPADVKKEGPSFDLPIAVSILCAGGRFQPAVNPDNIVLIGELSLDGSLRPVRGALPMVISAGEAGLSEVILPEGNAAEVNTLEGMRIYPAVNLKQVIGHLSGQNPIPCQVQKTYDELKTASVRSMDLQMIKGQYGAKRALEIAAAGGHNLLMIGVPGSGKTMLARSLPGILPPLTLEESLETTRIHSVAGKLPPGGGLLTQRPFAAPHHSASVASLIGGGANAMPGEVSLAHNGVLFLDELPEFSKAALEALRQPLEDGVVSVTRVARQAQYQSDFMLVASMNPCPCGYYGSTTRECRCTPHEIRRYLDRISGPLLDRIDIQIEVDAVPVAEINRDDLCESSATVAERVMQARKIQQVRYAHERIHRNAQLDASLSRKYCALDHVSIAMMNKAVDRMGLSMRAYGRVLKVARTVADLRGDEKIRPQDVAEAISFRELDMKYWR